MIGLALFAALTLQDTNTVLPPRVRTMLERFPPPRGSVPSIATGFSREMVWVGEQVELVTAAWFPRLLRLRLRHQPQIRTPSLSGLWSAHNQQVPIQAATRMVGSQVYDLFVAWQTIFPIGAGRIEAPPAMLSYGVPTSSSYFAPEERKSFVSATVTLIVRPIPPALAAELGTGPVAQNLRLAWRGPATGVRAGAPAIMELVLSGEGNLTLWPAPRVAWPPGVHVYPEPTEEHAAPSRGLIAGEKRFRFTVVADSGGVIALPAVTYPYFDPTAVAVRSAFAATFALVVLPRPAAVADRRPPAVTGAPGVPLATALVRAAWPAWLLLVALPPVLVLWRRRRAPVRVLPAATYADPEAALRAALGTPLEAGPDHVIAALREHGIPREDAEHVHRWLSATARRRYGPGSAPETEAPPIITRVLARLKYVAFITIALMSAGPVRAAQDGGVPRYEGRDYAGAARAFSAATQRDPAAAAAWRDLGAARWMQGDDPGAAAAWIQALRLAPRDPLLRSEWNGATVIPPDVRALVPRIPVSRDELILMALLTWIAAWIAIAVRWRRVAWVGGALLVGIATLTFMRWHVERPGRALLVANTMLHMAPHAATTPLPVGEISAWSQVEIERRDQGWVLVNVPLTTSTLGASSVAGWVPIGAIAPIGP